MNLTDLNKIAEEKFPYPILKDGRQAKFNIIDVTICQRDAYISGLQDSGMVKALALEAAVEIIKTWHNMINEPLLKDKIDSTWKIYYEKSPEMKIIREALSGINETKTIK